MTSEKDTVIYIDNPKQDKQAKTSKEDISILCIDLTNQSKFVQIIVCSIVVFTCYLTFGYFVEQIFTNPEVKPISLYITLWQMLITVMLAFIESVIRNPIERRVPLKIYALLAALTLGTLAFSNLALSYLNYPTQLIFKSCKLVPVMIGSIIIMKKSYGFLDYVAAALMCIGLTLFTIADSKVSPNFDVRGVIIISLALLCDAVIGNLQEKSMKQFQATNNEIIVYSYVIACGYLTVISGFSGILWNGMIYCYQHGHSIYPKVFMLSLSGYLGIQAVLTLVRISGATVAVTVTTMRKAVSIIMSFLLFEKQFVFQYAWSGMLIVIAIYLNLLSKKHPNYTPRLVRRCLSFVRTMYQYEYRYLSMRSKGYSNNV